MDRYISMLRGINVGVQKRVKMEQLTAIYQSLGFKDIRTYLQSGNVVFSAERTDIRELTKAIEEQIKGSLKIQAAVILRTPKEMQRIIKNNPFMKEKGIDTEKLYVTFLSALPEQPSTVNLQPAPDGKDKFIIDGSEVYLFCPEGYGRTRYSNDYFERKLGISATTRNWKTVNQLLAYSEFAG
jgi:uncharacterized protein (DUF1697 family)